MPIFSHLSIDSSIEMSGSDNDDMKDVPSPREKNRLSEMTLPDSVVRSPLLTTLSDKFIINHAKIAINLKVRLSASWFQNYSLTANQIWPSYISKRSKLQKPTCSHYVPKLT
ncbi:hypothetical protein CDAR_189821 [Caerostris darwini]|uniref:Uncharacterized protein n=1 Tax=Caerostris darwini TaxID=1538125 RepID=A0AAV4VL67_9ARAC|nr:hypothetical protein CDAR_189821 [Caerostris darwini]